MQNMVEQVEHQEVAEVIMDQTLLVLGVLVVALYLEQGQAAEAAGSGASPGAVEPVATSRPACGWSTPTTS